MHWERRAVWLEISPTYISCEKYLLYLWNIDTGKRGWEKRKEREFLFALFQCLSWEEAFPLKSNFSVSHPETHNLSYLITITVIWYQNCNIIFCYYNSHGNNLKYFSPTQNFKINPTLANVIFYDVLVVSPISILSTELRQKVFIFKMPIKKKKHVLTSVIWPLAFVLRSS